MLIDPINNIQKKLFKSITDKRAVFFFFSRHVVDHQKDVFKTQLIWKGEYNSCFILELKCFFQIKVCLCCEAVLHITAPSWKQISFTCSITERKVWG